MAKLLFYSIHLCVLAGILLGLGACAPRHEKMQRTSVILGEPIVLKRGTNEEPSRYRPDEFRIEPVIETGRIFMRRVDDLTPAETAMAGSGTGTSPALTEGPGMAAAQGETPGTVSMVPASEAGYPRHRWVDLRQFQLVLHVDNMTMADLVTHALEQARPYVGPWDVKWKLKRENEDILYERFSLDVETSFESFAGYLSDFVNTYRGFPLVFQVFEAERLLVISDE